MNEENKLNHIAIIIDGNRRYAKKHSWEVWKGHDSGAENVDKLFDWCKELGIKKLTIYALSTENLKREPKEVKALLDVFRKWFGKFKNDPRIPENQVRVRFIGKLELLPEDLQALAREIEENTSSYSNFHINFCIAYGGRLELLETIKKIIKSGKKPEEVTEDLIKQNLWLEDEPDAIVRTGNVKRLSNFLPWQSAYSELIFVDKLWPEFTKEDLVACVEEFKARKRNFGK
ncbi:MAG: polyprenyl diphosphate synthase [Candidatus Pacearchaeota archaeon]|nr:polyprenyl diphosphate synthase [Candidatus Pacearchaeota archaeon]